MPSHDPGSDAVLLSEILARNARKNTCLRWEDFRGGKKLFVVGLHPPVRTEMGVLGSTGPHGNCGTCTKHGVFVIRSICPF